MSAPRILSTINWEVSSQDAELIDRIVDRAKREKLTFSDSMRLEMDLRACHANGMPLALEQLLKAARIDFAHDLAGITRHINRRTGTLMDCFVPRYALQNGGPQ